MRQPHYLAWILPVLFLPSLAVGDVAPITTIAFGSCYRQTRPSPIFSSIARLKPQVWIWLGDNIYGDTTDMDVLAAKYALLSSDKTYAFLRGHCQVIGTWDDHDYGTNDVGKGHPKRVESQRLFLDFLQVPALDPRRNQRGVHASHSFGPKGREVKVILLDSRYHRDAPGAEADILGEAQWRWLEKELKDSSARVHILGSSIQVVATDHSFEKWSDFPKAKKRLFALLTRADIPPVTILSGDRHLAEISVESAELSYPLYDITSSSLNAPTGGGEREFNKRRVGKNFGEANFGTLEIDWSSSPPNLSFVIRNSEGEAVRSIQLQQDRKGGP